MEMASAPQVLAALRDWNCARGDAWTNGSKVVAFLSPRGSQPCLGLTRCPALSGSMVSLSSNPSVRWQKLLARV